MWRLKGEWIISNAHIKQKKIIFFKLVIAQKLKLRNISLDQITIRNTFFWQNFKTSSKSRSIRGLGKFLLGARKVDCTGYYDRVTPLLCLSCLSHFAVLPPPSVSHTCTTCSTKMASLHQQCLCNAKNITPKTVLSYYTIQIYCVCRCPQYCPSYCTLDIVAQRIKGWQRAKIWSSTMPGAGRVRHIKDLINTAVVLPSPSPYRDVTSLVRFLFSSKERRPCTIFFEALKQQKEGEFPQEDLLLDFQLSSRMFKT